MNESLKLIVKHDFRQKWLRLVGKLTKLTQNDFDRVNLMVLHNAFLINYFILIQFRKVFRRKFAITYQQLSDYYLAKWLAKIENESL